ncbi:MAG: VRR-NUC domain-containing protein [Bacteroidales bacterium]|nr:VRR-NUC domain-containing protein [Bacteroidales bacterium]
MKKLLHIAFTEDQRLHFRNGNLIKIWKDTYPEIFDEDDIRLAWSQGTLGYKFYEWLAAITIYNSMGYLSLLEKYEFPKHKKKHQIFKSLVPDNLFEFIMSKKEKRSQCPDLLCYSIDKADWFFCEVKGKGDRLKKDQSKYFESIELLSGKEIYLIKIDKMTN